MSDPVTAFIEASATSSLDSLLPSQRNEVVSSLLPASPSGLARLLQSKQAIAALQACALGPHQDTAVSALRLLNALPWSLETLQQHKLGKTLKRASALNRPDKAFNLELDQMFSTINRFVVANANPSLKSTIKSGSRDQEAKDGNTAGVIKGSADGESSSIKNEPNSLVDGSLKNSPLSPHSSSVERDVGSRSSLNKDPGEAGKNGGSTVVPFDPFECQSKLNKKQQFAGSVLADGGLPETSAAAPRQQTQHEPASESRANHMRDDGLTVSDVYVEILTPHPLVSSSKKRTVSEHATPSTKKKRVTFEPDDKLTAVRLFELDPTERRNPNFNPAMAYNDLNDEEEMTRMQLKNNVDDIYLSSMLPANPSLKYATFTWRMPVPWQFNEHYTLVDGPSSLEKGKLQRRMSLSRTYSCKEISKCPSNPMDPPPAEPLSYLAPKIIPLKPATSATNAKNDIDENALNSLIGSLTNTPLHPKNDIKNYNQLPVCSPIPSYQMGINMASAQYSSYPQYHSVPPNTHQPFISPPATSPQAKQSSNRIRQINCPPEKLRRVRCHYYDPKNPAACARGDNCTFLHQ